MKERHTTNALWEILTMMMSGARRASTQQPSLLTLPAAGEEPAMIGLFVEVIFNILLYLLHATKNITMRVILHGWRTVSVALYAYSGTNVCSSRSACKSSHTPVSMSMRQALHVPSKVELVKITFAFSLQRPLPHRCLSDRIWRVSPRGKLHFV